MDYQSRIDRLRERMVTVACDLFVLAPGSNLRYFTGFNDDPLERLLLCVLPLDSEPVFVAPKLFQNQIQQESPFQDVRIWLDVDGPGKVLAETLTDLRSRSGKTLVDDRMSMAIFKVLGEALGHNEAASGGEILADLRLCKEPEELDCMKRAAEIADAALERILERGLAGMSEQDVSEALKSEMRSRGANGSSFEPIVGAGPNGATGHHRPGSRRIAVGDAVILDFGCQVEGYCSDMTRTVICSAPSEEVERVYRIVQTAQEAAVAAVRPGMEAQEIDKIANELVLRSGLGERHRTGHGIGLDVHEPPYIGKGQRTVLEEGMTFSVEPGIYLRGRFGVRIEDVVAVTRTGAEPMSGFTRALLTAE